MNAWRLLIGITILMPLAFGFVGARNVGGSPMQIAAFAIAGLCIGALFAGVLNTVVLQVHRSADFKPRAVLAKTYQALYLGGFIWACLGGVAAAALARNIVPRL